MMETKRKIKDLLANGSTYLSASISLIVLLAIILFVFINGAKTLSFKMLTSSYYETPYFAIVEANDEDFSSIEEKEGVYYSYKYGIGIKDSKDLEKKDAVEIVYIDEKSPFNSAKSGDGKTLKIKVGQQIKRIQVKGESGIKVATTSSKASGMIEVLDSGDYINEFYYVDMGGGIRGSLLATLMLVGLTLLIVIPIGVISAIYLSLYAKDNKFTSLLRSLIDMIGGIPSIIFGLISLIVFIPFVSKISSSNGASVLAGAFTLSIMLLPTVIRTTEERINAIPKTYQSASLALGASLTQTAFKVILPNALPGILTSIILCIGRIIGESAALIFAMGTAIQDNVGILQPATTLAVHIWSVMADENPNFGLACAISIIILVIVLMLNILVKLVSLKFKKYEVKK